MPVLTVMLMHSVSLYRPYNVNVSAKTRKTNNAYVTNLNYTHRSYLTVRRSRRSSMQCTH